MCVLPGQSLGTTARMHLESMRLGGFLWMTTRSQHYPFPLRSSTLVGDRIDAHERNGSLRLPADIVGLEMYQSYPKQK